MSCKPILDHERVIWLETFFYSTTLLAYSITRGLERGGDQGSPPPFNFFNNKNKCTFNKSTFKVCKSCY